MMNAKTAVPQKEPRGTCAYCPGPRGLVRTCCQNGESCLLFKHCLGGDTWQTLGRHWTTIEKILGRYWEDTGKTLGRRWKDNEKTLGRHWEDVGKTMRRHWEDIGETLGRHCDDTGKTQGRHRKDTEKKKESRCLVNASKKYTFQAFISTLR